MVQCLDNMKLAAFQEWVQACVWGPAKVDKKAVLDLRCVSISGAVMPIKDFKTLSNWIDSMWCRFPLELYLYDAGHAVRPPPDAAERLFDALDRDGNGHLDVHETLAATKMSVVRDNVAHQDVSAFLQRAFTLC